MPCESKRRMAAASRNTKMDRPMAHGESMMVSVKLTQDDPNTHATNNTAFNMHLLHCRGGGSS